MEPTKSVLAVSSAEYTPEELQLIGTCFGRLRETLREGVLSLCMATGLTVPEAELKSLLSRPLAELDIVVLLIDGVQFSDGLTTHSSGSISNQCHRASTRSMSLPRESLRPAFAEVIHTSLT